MLYNSKREGFMVNVLDLFSPEQLSQFKEGFTQKGEVCYNGPCPSCGRCDGYSGFIIFVSSNTCYCRGSKTIFNMMETIALLNGIITCREGRQKI